MKDIFRCNCCGDPVSEGVPCSCAYQQCEGACWDKVAGCSKPSRTKMIPEDHNEVLISALLSIRNGPLEMGQWLRKYNKTDCEESQFLNTYQKIAKYATEEYVSRNIGQALDNTQDS